VAEGTFPFPGEAAMLVRSPRVGDGLLRLGPSGRVTYASPYAQSAYRRLGLAADLIGAELAAITAGLSTSDEPLDESLMVVAAGRAPRAAEVDGNGSVVQLRSIPLIVGGTRTGALILVRDVTELRHRERELMTKDATIREIHHRVKNNLQTVAALLRLQARRLHAPEARAALDEAVRRVGSIAVVHETLSHAPEEIVDFDEIADRVAMMAGEVSAPEVRVIPKITGSRTTCRPWPRCSGCRPGACTRPRPARRWMRRSGGSARSRWCTRPCLMRPKRSWISTRSRTGSR
jgi:two-component system, sensor histidine kinase PdtaS